MCAARRSTGSTGNTGCTGCTGRPSLSTPSLWQQVQTHDVCTRTRAALEPHYTYSRRRATLPRHARAFRHKHAHASAKSRGAARSLS
jgi:hypothetical protein